MTQLAVAVNLFHTFLSVNQCALLLRLDAVCRLTMINVSGQKCTHSDDPKQNQGYPIAIIRAGLYWIYECLLVNWMIVSLLLTVTVRLQLPAWLTFLGPEKCVATTVPLINRDRPSIALIYNGWIKTHLQICTGKHCL